MSVTTTAAVALRQPHMVCKQVGVAVSPNFMDTEIRISCNCHESQNILFKIFSKPFKNVKVILSLWAVQKQEVAGFGL